MRKTHKTEFARKQSEDRRESTLLPMLIGGLVLALVGMVAAVMIV